MLFPQGRVAAKPGASLTLGNGVHLGGFLGPLGSPWELKRYPPLIYQRSASSRATGRIALEAEEVTRLLGVTGTEPQSQLLPSRLQGP